jgi:hypothetical protein
VIGFSRALEQQHGMSDVHLQYGSIGQSQAATVQSKRMDSGKQQQQ